MKRYNSTMLKKNNKVRIIRKMNEFIPLPSTLFTRLRVLLECITVTIILFLSFDNGVMTVTSAFQSSPNSLRHSLRHSLLYKSPPDSFFFISSLSLSCSSSDTGELSELELLQRSLYQKEFDNLRHKSTWLDSMKQLPFDCTGCGNCCKTTGNVYMSPEEVSSAASYKNMTTSKFIDLYADYRLETTSASTSSRVSKALAAGGGEVPWILLQNRKPASKKKNDRAEGQQQQPAACVFLDRETNQCGIYSVRPIQCSTYPFWSNILESEQNWNDEVRRKDGNNERTTTFSSDQQHLPTWTPDGGGCEGMRILHDIDVDNDVDVEAAADESEGVPVTRALQQLSLYKRADRRLPRTYNKIRLQND